MSPFMTRLYLENGGSVFPEGEVDPRIAASAAACRGCGDAPAAFLCTVEPALGYCRACIRNHVDQAHAGTSVGVLELKSGTKVEMKSGFKDPFGVRGRIDFSAFLEESDQ